MSLGVLVYKKQSMSCCHLWKKRNKENVLEMKQRKTKKKRRSCRLLSMLTAHNEVALLARKQNHPGSPRPRGTTVLPIQINRLQLFANHCCNCFVSSAHINAACIRTSTLQEQHNIEKVIWAPFACRSVQKWLCCKVGVVTRQCQPSPAVVDAL